MEENCLQENLLFEETHLWGPQQKPEITAAVLATIPASLLLPASEVGCVLQLTAEKDGSSDGLRLIYSLSTSICAILNVFFLSTPSRLPSRSLDCLQCYFRMQIPVCTPRRRSPLTHPPLN